MDNFGKTFCEILIFYIYFHIQNCIKFFTFYTIKYFNIILYYKLKITLIFIILKQFFIKILFLNMNLIKFL